MKITPFNDFHLELGAKMAPFGGYQMPIQYSGIKQEHLAVRSGVGVFDVSHMGEFTVEGAQAFDLLQFICSNDISKLQPGKAQYNYFPNEQGGIVDDLIVYQVDVQKYLLVVNAANIEKDWKHIQKFNQKFKAELKDISEKIALLAIQGPDAMATVQSLCEANLTTMKHYSHLTTTLAGIDDVLIATTGYTGAGGVEIYFDPSNARHLWRAIMEAGQDYGIIPVGLAARDTLRLEMGYCLYGNEIDDNTSPISAGLGWVTRPQTGFLNAETHQKTIAGGTEEKLIGFIIEERGIARSGYGLFDVDQNPIGKVTSGTQSPSLQKGIGMGYVKNAHAQPGHTLLVEIREKFVPATVIKPPFIK